MSDFPRRLGRPPRGRALWIVVGIAALLILAGTAWLLMRKGGGEKAAAEAEPTATVTLTEVRSATLDDLVSAFGTVQAEQSSVYTVAAPRAAVIARIYVRPGQVVAAGQPLVELADAPASAMAYRQAVGVRDFAVKELERVKRMYGEHLATNDQLNAAEKALSDANAALAAQNAQGSGKARQIVTAPFAAVVTAVSTAAGDRIAQDAPVMVLAHQNGVAARLGLEPIAARRVAAGQAVTLRSVFDKSAAFQSRLTIVGRQADAATKTVEAVAPLGGAILPIGSAITGDIVVGSHAGLVVPRSAVVFDETGPHLFLADGEKARLVAVTPGLSQGDNLEVKGELKAGDKVVVEGAYELQDGMKVRAARR